MARKELPGNLHYQDPNPDIESLQDGRLCVVSKNMPFCGRFVAVNSFGFGGTNVHAVFRVPRDEYEYKDSFASCIRLCTHASRTEEVSNCSF